MSNAEDHATGNITNGGSDTVEKDFSYGGSGYHLDNNHDADDALRKIRTTGSLSISPELFEKIYLSPQNKVAGELRKTVGNPTPLALGGFLLCTNPLSNDLMGWRGAGGNGAAGIGFYFGFGGICMLLGAIGEWILGNTFPAVVFGTFGGFWVAFGMTLMPYVGAVADYTTLKAVDASDVANFAAGVKNPQWNSSFAFILVYMAVLCTVYTVCALRTNLILFLILLLLLPTFSCLAAYFFYIEQGKTYTILLFTGGALLYVVSLLGWYIFAAILLAAVDFPFELPVFDLSHIIKGASDKKKNSEGEA